MSEHGRRLGRLGGLILVLVMLIWLVASLPNRSMSLVLSRDNGSLRRNHSSVSSWSVEVLLSIRQILAVVSS